LFSHKVSLHTNPLARSRGQVKTGCGQVKIMKEFVKIFFFFLNLAFGQVGEKN